MSITDALRNALKAPTITPAHPEIDNSYEPLGEAYEATAGGTTDVGSSIDTTNEHAAGGFPPDVEAGDPFIGDVRPLAIERDDHECDCKRPKVNSWQSARYAATADDVATRRAFVVTPSGADSDSITSITLVASTENAFRIGSDDNSAQVGAYLPPWFPVTLATGPVYVTCYTADATLDVIVEYTA